MALTVTLASGQTLIIPDSSVDINVVNQPTGVALSGVVTLVGEADEGPSWKQDLQSGIKPSQNSYSVGDINRVTAKYGSGPLVDAYRAAIAPSASTRIQGGPNRIILVKANDSTQADLSTADGLELKARRGGEAGNDITASVATLALEEAPATEQFTYIPNAAAATLAYRTNGRAQATLSIPASTTPQALATALTGQGQVNVVGGVNFGAIDNLIATDTLAVEIVSSGVIRVRIGAPKLWTNAPSVGDTLQIPSGSVIAGTLNANVGYYIIQEVANAATGAYVVARTLTGTPAAVAPTALGVNLDDLSLIAYSSMNLENMSGSDRLALTGLIGTTLTATATGSKLKVSLPVSSVFASTPKIGDIVWIPSTSIIAGASNENVGWYDVTLTNNDITSAFVELSRRSNGLPVNDSGAIAAITDLNVLDPQIPGFGKSMELYDGAGAANISLLFRELGDTAAASWIDDVLVSQSELSKQIFIKRSSEAAGDTFSVGGKIALEIGYKGTTATASILEVSGKLHLQTSVVGGAGANIDLDLSKISTMQDLVSKLNLLTGYSAAVGSVSDGLKNPSILDKGTYDIASSHDSVRAGRIKRDASDINALSSSRAFISMNESGLPEDFAPTFLSGGDKGGTTSLQFSQAIDALQGVRTNFVVPLVSQDASKDIAENLTEATSTYTVDAVNAAVKSHCISMSTPKVKRHRIGVVSKRGTFIQAQASAQNMANFRIAHLFQDVLNLNSQGEIEQFQPWMGATIAASMQAAGNYKSIYNKEVNISGAIQAAGDFDDENDSQVEDAILNGLIPIQRQETGGFKFVTDQMTYGLDNNIIYNSMQAVYVADLMALSLAESLKRAFVGESVADVNEGVATSFIKGKLAEFQRLKWIVSSAQQGAPAGWKYINVKIEGAVMYVEVCVIEATTIRFIPIGLEIEGIRTSSSSLGA